MKTNTKKTPEEIQAEQDALASQAEAEAEAQAEAEWQHQQDMDAQAEYDANRGPEEYGPEGEY